MTLLQIKYVIAIAEAGSMNRAAEQLFLSQPALTSAVRELETEIGITLFIRSGRGSRLTAEGENFLKKARILYEQAQMLEDSYKAETFAYFTQTWPGAITLLGIADPSKGSGAPLHSPQFDIDEDALLAGVEYFVRFALA